MKTLDDIQQSLNQIEKDFSKMPYPKSVLIELTNRCNLDCIQCAQSCMQRNKGDMDFELYKKIIDDIAQNAPNTKAWLSNYGEPLLRGPKMVYEMLKYAKNKGLADLYMNSNGMLLDEAMSNALIDGGLDHLILGIDGYSAGVYESIRVGANRDVVYDNILRLKEIMQQKGKTNPRIEVQFIVMEENEHELEQYRKYWKEKEIAVRVRPRTTWGGNVAKGKNILDNLQRIACGFSIATFHITWDGQVVACGHDINATFVVGNINEQSISDIWGNIYEKYIKFHLEHRFGELPEFCKKCNDWQTIGSANYDENGQEYKKSYQYMKGNK